MAEPTPNPALTSDVMAPPAPPAPSSPVGGGPAPAAGQPTASAGVVAPTVAHHTAFGAGVKRVLSSLYGNQYDYKVNDDGSTERVPIENKPGDIFRHIIAGAILGGAAGDEAKGFERQSAIAGAARGGAAVMKHTTDADAQRRKEAQEQYENQLKSKRETREKQQFDTEQQLRHAQIAMTNAQAANINMESLGKSLTWHKEVSSEDSVNAQPYIDAGMKKAYDNISESEFAQLQDKRPDIGHTLEWYHTGVRTVLDKQGNPNVEYTLSAFDPKGEVNVGKKVFDKWKKDGLFQTHPELESLLEGKDSYKMDAKQYATVNHLDRQAYAENLTRRKDEFDLNKIDAETKEHIAAAARDYAMRAKDLADAGKTKEDKKNANLLYDAMKDLDSTNGDVSKLKPSSRFIIGQNAVKLAQDATAEAKAILSDQTNYDEKDKQAKATQKMEEAGFWRNLARSPFAQQPAAAAPAAAPVAAPAAAARAAGNDAGAVDKAVKRMQNTNNVPSSFAALKIDPSLSTNSQRLMAASKLGVEVPWSEIVDMATAVGAPPDEFAAKAKAAGVKVEDKPDWSDQSPTGQ